MANVWKCVLNMALWKYVKQEGRANGASSNLSMKDIEAVQKSISKTLDVAASDVDRINSRLHFTRKNLPRTGTHTSL